jgi:hypothetical protein
MTPEEHAAAVEAMALAIANDRGEAWEDDDGTHALNIHYSDAHAAMDGLEAYMNEQEMVFYKP